MPIAVSTSNYLGIVANPGAPFKSIAEMIAYAKANPGRLTVATNGEGGFPHLAFEHLRMMGASIHPCSVQGVGADRHRRDRRPSAGGHRRHHGPAPHMRSGGCACWPSPTRRAALWPDTPAAAETVPGYESGGWFGYVAPAGTPREIVVKLNEEINRAMKLPEIAEKMVAGGMVVVAESPEYFEDPIKSDYAKYGKLVRDIGFKPQ